MDKIIKAKLSEQTLILEGLDGIVSDSIGYLGLTFDTPEIYAGCETCFLFRHLDRGVYAVYSGGGIEVPQEVIRAPGFTVSLTVTDGDVLRVTSTEVFVPVTKSGYRKCEAPSAPTPDIYAQILSLAGDAVNPPYIGENGNWYLYDSEKKVYLDSGKKAEGGSNADLKVILDPDNNPLDDTEKPASHQKVYVGDHYLTQEEIDPGIYQLSLRSGLDMFTVFTVKTPVDKSEEATVCVMNDANGTVQFADLSSLRYDDSLPGQIMIVCQARGETPLPYFSVAFNDGKGAGKVEKLTVQPDAVPMMMTSAGLKVRRDNSYDNNWTDENSLTVDLAKMADRLEGISENIESGISLMFEDTEFGEKYTVIYPENPLLYSWDFTSSLTDTVAGLTAVCSGASRDSDGLLLDDDGEYCVLGDIFAPGRSIEFDVAETSADFGTSAHGRCFMIYTPDVKGTEGLIWRHQAGAWAFYVNSGWDASLPITDRDAFSGKTVRLSSDAAGYISLYVDGEFIAKSGIAFNSERTRVAIGSEYSGSFNDMRITAVRVYKEEEK